MLHRITSAIRYLLGRPAVEQALDAELSFHFDHLVEQNIQRGMKPEQARREARITLGSGLESVKDECRDVRLGHVIETILQDLRYGLRTLWKGYWRRSAEMALPYLIVGSGLGRLCGVEQGARSAVNHASQ